MKGDFMKKNRHEAILKIIETNCVSTQTELLEMLNAEGYDTTQATVSRDIKDLRLIKKPDQYGRSCYAVDKANNTELTGKYNSVFAHSVVSSDFAGNMLAIKCYTGMANAACAALDVMDFDGIVGTLAGDDTVFCVMRDNASAVSLRESALEILSSRKDKN